MRGGVLLLLVAILMAYLAVSGKYRCFTVFARCVSGDGSCDCQEAAQDALQPVVSGMPSVRLPGIPPLSPLPSLSMRGRAYG